MIGFLVLSIICVYDGSGKKFHRLRLFEFKYKKYPDNISDSLRHLRHRETLYHLNENWKNRCKFLFCCINKNKVKVKNLFLKKPFFLERNYVFFSNKVRTL